MLDKKVIENEEFLSWPVIGKGAERTCYQNPNDASRCIKVSYKDNSKQAKKEIKYFNYLLSKKASFSYIPKVYSTIDNDVYLGIEQEVILNKNGSVSNTLPDYIRDNKASLNISSLKVKILELKDNLIDNNIIPSDLVATNLLVRETGDDIKIYLIDGFGSTELIPLVNFFPTLGRRKINRKFDYFFSYNFPKCLKRNYYN